MWKVAYRYRRLLTLPGLILLAAFFINGGAEVLWGWGVPNVAAAGLEGQKRPGECTASHVKPAFGSTIVVSSGEVICSNLTAWDGNILIKGDVRGDVVTFGGNVVVDGRVEGTIRSYVGDVTLQSEARVYGDIYTCGGQQTQDRASQLYGTIFDCPKTVELLLEGSEGAGFHFWSLLTWVALGIILTFLLPEHVMLVRTTASIKIRRSLFLGILSVLLAPAVLAVLIALIIPIPLAIIVIIGLMAGWALGTVAIGWLIGEYLVNKVAPQHHARPIQVAVGLAVLALAGSLPYIGWFISIGAGLLGLGAVFLSRFGTRLYSQPKQPLPL